MHTVLLAWKRVGECEDRAKRAETALRDALRAALIAKETKRQCDADLGSAESLLRGRIAKVHGGTYLVAEVGSYPALPRVMIPAFRFQSNIRAEEKQCQVTGWTLHFDKDRNNMPYYHRADQKEATRYPPPNFSFEVVWPASRTDCVREVNGFMIGMNSNQMYTPEELDEERMRSVLRRKRMHASQSDEKVEATPPRKRMRTRSMCKDASAP